ncbi:hypothetical protein [Azospirillum thermophilum]|uniref:Uncharacterized protein n=1 Tax=Azospirillum thermophilum TaxID=2202148 RepID=A0A2S2CLH8_9PROT|nr:hypothetical protein [Azospirillum thermophilum]AWK85331.1 hypothetical protein DEW08_03300 [Azospirillum thermophilum]
MNAFRLIRHADGRTYYDGRPLTLADAQIMLNDDIQRRRVAVDSYLRVDGAELIVECPQTAAHPAGQDRRE